MADASALDVALLHHEQGLHDAVRTKWQGLRRDAQAAFRERIRAEHPDAEFLPYSFAYRLGNQTVARGWLPSPDEFTSDDTNTLWETAFCTLCPHPTMVKTHQDVIAQVLEFEANLNPSGTSKWEAD